MREPVSAASGRESTAAKGTHAVAVGEALIPHGKEEERGERDEIKDLLSERREDPHAQEEPYRSEFEELHGGEAGAEDAGKDRLERPLAEHLEEEDKCREDELREQGREREQGIVLMRKEEEKGELCGGGIEKALRPRPLSLSAV